MTLRMRITAAILTATVALPASSALAEGEVNLYSSRHYDTDERLYSDFEKETGIRINRIEGNADELIGATLLLAAPVAGSFITGIEMVVDGGFNAMRI